jgi:cobalt/nickel transport system permease protein
MHMADALLSPAVGGVMWATSAAAIAWSSRRLRRELDDSRVPLMGVLAAFIFAAQMVNFAIPGTGSSGHLGGGLILAVLLGPEAGFLAMASVLTVQALFFADGGLLALGCNICNLGFFPCFIAYPFIYRPLVGRQPTPRRLFAGAGVAAIVGLQLGACGVVVETALSGLSALPLGFFLLLMLPIHLAIGVVEGMVTALVIGFLWKARPEVFTPATSSRPVAGPPLRRLLAGVLAAALLTAGGLSWLASSRPDGLEWALSHAAAGSAADLPAGGGSPLLTAFQAKIALLPDYGFRTDGGKGAEAAGVAGSGRREASPAVKAETSVAGLVGGSLTLLLAAGLGLLLRRRRLVAPPRP